MKILGDMCHKEEAILLLPNDQVRFECSNTRDLRPKELKVPFGRYGGKQ